MNEDIAIKVDGVYKDFLLPHEKADSIKSAFTGILRGKKGRTIEKQHALKDISLEIKKGEFFGIVGRNGSGKSTLLKILAGIYQPTRGNVSVNGRLVPFIELGVGFNPELTGRENVYLSAALLGFSQKEVDAMYKSIVEFAELEKFMDQKLKNYSSGMQVRLAFSVAVRADADILLIDEVLAVGDADFQRKCFDYFKKLKKDKVTVVFVTHDMSSVREYCDRAILIEKSEIVISGSTSNVASGYSKMFIKDNINQASSDKTNRWGAGTIQFKKVSCNVSDKTITIQASAIAKNNVDKCLYGMHVVGPDGKDITATNNRMLLVPDVEDICKGNKIDFEWQIQNIFSDGQYDINLTLVNSSGEVLDWYEGATSFSVMKEAHSTTSVSPPITVISKIKKG